MDTLVAATMLAMGAMLLARTL
jgi:hypothetical protein